VVGAALGKKFNMTEGDNLGTGTHRKVRGLIPQEPCNDGEARGKGGGIPDRARTPELIAKFDIIQTNYSHVKGGRKPRQAELGGEGGTKNGNSRKTCAKKEDKNRQDAEGPERTGM